MAVSREGVVGRGGGGGGGGVIDLENIRIGVVSQYKASTTHVCMVCSMHPFY